MVDPIRFKFTFSLRTLLIAVLLVSVGLWWFLNGSVFYERDIVTLFKSSTVPNEHGFFPAGRLIAFVSQHRNLPNRNRVHLVMIDRQLSFASAGGSRTTVDADFWGPNSIGDIRFHHSSGTRILPSKYNAATDWQSVWFPTDDRHPTRTAFIETQGTEEMSLADPNTYKFLKLGYAELEEFAMKAPVEEWTIASLEKWISEQNK